MTNKNFDIDAEEALYEELEVCDSCYDGKMVDGLCDNCGATACPICGSSIDPESPCCGECEYIKPGAIVCYECENAVWEHSLDNGCCPYCGNCDM